MKIGIIGLGDIAQKAYLPVLGNKEDLKFVLATRNSEKLRLISSQYRIPEYVHTIDELINTGIDAAFVHTATKAHFEIVEQLLKHHIHVYVDKPLAYSYSEAQRLVDLSIQKNKLLLVGFNRRFAPMYKQLKKIESRRTILMQKNRIYLPGEVRSFIYDDFIHVVDTLRFLVPDSIEDFNVHYIKKNNKLLQVVLQLSGNDFTAIGIMNRDSGTTEETLEVISPGNKWIIQNLVETIHYKNGEEKRFKFDEWENTLYRRGFVQIIDRFLEAVKHPTQTIDPSPLDSLKTHELCEKIVAKIESDR